MEQKATKKDLKSENAELISTVKQLQADFENYKKRIARDTAKLHSMATKDVLHELLAVTDSFDRALDSKKEDAEFEKGIAFVHKQLKELLEQRGVEPIKALNQPFDPYLHQAIMKQHDNTVDNNLVVEEFEKGYTLQGDVLRHAKVKVNIHQEE